MVPRTWVAQGRAGPCPLWVPRVGDSIALPRLLTPKAAVWCGLAAVSPWLPGKYRVLSAAFYIGSISIPPSVHLAAAATTPA